MQYQAKDLFQLQAELVEAKIDMAATKAIDRVLDRIDGLQKDMDMRFSSLESDMVAVKTKLGMSEETRSVIRTKLIEYALQAVWLSVGSVLTYVLIHLHSY